MKKEARLSVNVIGVRKVVKEFGEIKAQILKEEPKEKTIMIEV
jgi:hypothetical protein